VEVDPVRGGRRRGHESEDSGDKWGLRRGRYGLARGSGDKWRAGVGRGWIFGVVGADGDGAGKRFRARGLGGGVTVDGLGYGGGIRGTPLSTGPTDTPDYFSNFLRFKRRACSPERPA
jgi:hypothetical protein